MTAKKSAPAAKSVAGPGASVADPGASVAGPGADVVAVLRRHAEEQYAHELAWLAQTDERPRPPGFAPGSQVCSSKLNQPSFPTHITVELRVP